MAWRYLARRAATGEWLDMDLPLVGPQPQWALNAAGSLQATIDPDVGQLRADDGRLLLDEWGTLIYAEADGRIRWGGILIHSKLEGATWRVEAAGVSTYPHGIPYLGEYRKNDLDPADAAREIWRHIQSFPNGNLGVVVDGTKTPVRLGEPAIPAYDEVFIGDKWVRKGTVPPSQIDPSASAKLKTAISASATSLTLAALGNYGKVALPAVVTIGREKIRVTGRAGTTLSGLQRGYDGSTATGHNAGTAVNHTGTKTRMVAAVPAVPYTLAWWDARDCGREFATLARQTPFDWCEETQWVGSGKDVEHRIRLGYPRLGRRRTDLSFQQGVNIVSAVPVQRGGDDYANEVFGLGAGEGRTIVNTRLPILDGRMRRVAVHADKSVTSGSRLDALCRDELLRRRGLLEVVEITVADHPHARIGSWAPGDDILVEVDVPWLGQVEVWSRVMAWSLLGEHRARLVLQRADSFVYGAG